MQVALIQNDGSWGRIRKQDSDIVDGIVRNIYNVNILVFVTTMMKNYCPDRFQHFFKMNLKFYERIGEGEVVKEIFRHIQDIYLFGDPGIFNDYKGAIVEKLCYTRMMPIYSGDNCTCERECLINIDDWQSEINVDVAGWNCNLENGDCYECKFSIGLTQDQKLLLDNIRNRSREKMTPHIFTFMDKDNYMNFLISSYPDTSFDIIGTNEIFS